MLTKDYYHCLWLINNLLCSCAGFPAATSIDYKSDLISITRSCISPINSSTAFTSFTCPHICQAVSDRFIVSLPHHSMNRIISWITYSIKQWLLLCGSSYWGFVENTHLSEASAQIHEEHRSGTNISITLMFSPIVGSALQTSRRENRRWSLQRLRQLQFRLNKTKGRASIWGMCSWSLAVPMLYAERLCLHRWSWYQTIYRIRKEEQWSRDCW